MTRPALALAAMLAALAASPARAYVPDTPTVFHRFALRVARLKTRGAPLTGRAALAGDGTVPADVRLSASECRVALEGTSSAAGYHAGRTTPEGTPPPAVEALVALTCPLVTLAGASPKEAEVATNRFAARLGVQLANVSLQRLDGRVALVVGARPRDLSRPQLWFDERTGLPLRVLGQVSGRLWDVRFEDPASIATGRQAPRRIAVFDGTRRALELTLMLAEPAPAGPSSGVGAGDGRADE